MSQWPKCHFERSQDRQVDFIESLGLRIGAAIVNVGALRVRWEAHRSPLAPHWYSYSYPYTMETHGEVIIPTKEEPLKLGTEVSCGSLLEGAFTLL